MVVSPGSYLQDLLPHSCYEQQIVISCQSSKIQERNDLDQLAHKCVQQKYHLVKASIITEAVPTP